MILLYCLIISGFRVCLVTVNGAVVVVVVEFIICLVLLFELYYIICY